MPAFEWRMDGHATGLACAAATRLERRVPFAAFKMAHPLQNRASVILEAPDEAAARELCAEACDGLCDDLGELLRQLPPDPHHKERLWPERQAAANFEVCLHPRQIDEEA